MNAKWLEDRLIYDGSQLRPLFNYMDHGLDGDSILSWRGGCFVGEENMVDGEDRRDGSRIAGDDMVHFLVEMFPANLAFGVATQRLLASLVQDVLREIAGERTLARSLRRDGDDLYLNDNKLSISIATVSPVSTLIHFAVNVTNEGTPVPTASLEDLGTQPEAFAEIVLRRFAQEHESLLAATKKVFPV